MKLTKKQLELLLDCVLAQIQDLANTKKRYIYNDTMIRVINQEIEKLQELNIILSNERNNE